MWVERLLEITGRANQELRIDWNPLEAELGLELPSKYKNMCESFGHGAFSTSIWVNSVDPNQVFDLLTNWRVRLEYTQNNVSSKSVNLYEPYAIYEPGKGGLIPWGAGDTGDEFYWLVQEGEKEARWPILGRVADSDIGDWDRYEMSVAEFLFRVLTDVDFRPFTLAPHVPDPAFTPAD
ncbi:hypothetical protein ACIBKZ_03465 [Streptomyces sp. NPDC050421]|uniref:hypothetical protein n=2 Tax=unclassified Streptomyces TaxID=2593676 RepID=UPI00378CBC77